MILHAAITYVLRFLAKVDAATWDNVIRWVQQAEKDISTLTTGAQRKEWVIGQLTQAAPHLGQWALDLIVGLAAGYAARRGWIHLSK